MLTMEAASIKRGSEYLFSVMHRGHAYITCYRELYLILVLLELEQGCTHLQYTYTYIWTI